MRRLNPGGAHRVAGDAVLRDEIEDAVRGIAAQADDSLTKFVAEHPFNGVRIFLESRQHLPAVATGGAPAGRMRVEHDGANAALSQVKRGRQPGEPGPDDRDIGRKVRLGESPEAMGRVRRRRPERAGETGALIEHAVAGGLRRVDHPVMSCAGWQKKSAGAPSSIVINDRHPITSVRVSDSCNLDPITRSCAFHPARS